MAPYIRESQADNGLGISSLSTMDSTYTVAPTPVHAQPSFAYYPESRRVIGGFSYSLVFVSFFLFIFLGIFIIIFFFSR